MVKVDSKKTLYTLARRFMKMNHNRNIIAVISIMLSSLLFTSLFMGTISLILSKRATEIRQSMYSSHTIIQNLSKYEFNNILNAAKDNEDIKYYGTGIFLGPVMNKEFSFSCELRSADKHHAESFNCSPVTGRLPENKDEAAVSSLVLDQLGIPHKLGSKVTITWEKNPVTKEYKTDTFTICGFWEGDKAILSQIIWVSDNYAQKEAYIPSAKDIKNKFFNGTYEFSIWYKNLWHLEQKTDKLNFGAQLTGSNNKFLPNPAYNIMEEDSFSYASVIVILIVIIIAGYLVIYNIFSISVKTDIRIYALLKNTGTTGRQLKKIVRIQALSLSAIGIPLGLIAGYITGICMAPSLTASQDIGSSTINATETVVSANPLIFIFAALMTLFTVYMSCLEACHTAGKVSPVEALKLSEKNGSFKKTQRNTSATWPAMALQNILRSWKKGLVVMFSISLSLIILDYIVILAGGFDFKQYQQIFLASDFQLDQVTSNLEHTNFNGISQETRDKLDKCPYSKAIGYIYFSGESHKMEQQITKIWKGFASKYKEYWGDYENNTYKQSIKTGNIKVHLIGLNKAGFNKLDWKEKPCAWEDFSSGKYVITDYNYLYTETPVSYYKTGDNFFMEYKSGSKKNYKILGEATVPFSLDYPYYDFMYITVFVPESEYIKNTLNSSAMYAAIDASKGMEQQVQDYIKENILKENNFINVFSVLDIKASFQKYISKYYTIGGILVAVLAFIGIMNFFNTTAASISSRKRELALLEAVGMPKRQIIKMLAAEGGIYLSGSFVLALPAVYFGAEKVFSFINVGFYFQVNITVLPCIIMFPFLIIIAIIIPKYQYNKIGCESIVERLDTPV